MDVLYEFLEAHSAARRNVRVLSDEMRVLEPSVHLQLACVGEALCESTGYPAVVLVVHSGGRRQRLVVVVVVSTQVAGQAVARTKQRICLNVVLVERGSDVEGAALVFWRGIVAVRARAIRAEAQLQPAVRDEVARTADLIGVYEP